MARIPQTRVAVPDGWVEAAAAVHRRLQCRSTYDVYLDPDGGLWMRQINRHFNSVLPDAWLVGRYRKSTPLKHIQEDAQARLREIYDSRCKRSAA